MSIIVDRRIGEMQHRHGQSWLPEEDEALEAALRSGVSVDQLADHHKRSVGAIRSRLKRLGLIETGPSTPSASDSAAIHAEKEPLETRLSAGIDQLVATLLNLKEQAELAPPGRRAIATVARAYDYLNVLLRETVAMSPLSTREAPSDDPLPDRFRAALANSVESCVSDPMDQIIALRLLGLVGDGEYVTLAQLSHELGRSHERIRQRRNRAFRTINAALPRRKGSRDRLRIVLAELSPKADWSNPAVAARGIVKIVNDNVVAAQQLTLMLMIASGAPGQTPALRHAAGQAAMEACRDPELLGHWKLDRWADVALKAIMHGQFAYFNTPPQDMIGRKRSPVEGSRGAAIPLRSDKLGRMVMCESGMEVKVFTWLERSEEVSWYQEQPVAFPYTMEGQEKLYYPDAVVRDREGRILVIEVKPIFNMFRQQTVEKGLAAIKHLQPRGIGYLLVDSSGRTLSDLAGHPYDRAVAEKLEALFSQGAVPFRVARDILSKPSGQFDFAAFISEPESESGLIDFSQNSADMGNHQPRVG
ncbi:DNA-directed RNA polymerase [Gluconacetobacter sp. SXCC-1]|uniref:sigma factor-like helix-turn-helix DNA-binding protein n=1 Tax=Komagataeibacter rhaeticus TaxID=215221 RepID=UPI000207FACD|nr:sigma factor-like helix-turn-helix DNA-binding protein [Komagataeibacter rhaeticus]EGG75689.1 DNA-directed RNA polymerase [Gluconacetobacter sp. SXCC-1]WPP23226.1 sigma factor-like helix-turn-helix DNA-binding protein [Komagataeibacter rhaeticus]